MRRDNSADTPEDAIKWAKNLHMTRERKPSLLQRIAAVLQVDLSPDQAVAGERSGSATQVRQMLFTAGDYAIDLRVTGTGKKIAVKGQILGSDIENGTVTLEGETGHSQVSLNESSMFEFKNLQGGAYSVTVTSKAIEIVVARIEI